MNNDFDDTVGGKRAYHKFLWGAAIGIVILGGALGYSSQLMDVGKVFPIIGPPDNAGAPKPADIK
ncbi:MAG: hypothetical protein ACRC9K_02175 [Afipia sp.]